MTCELLANARAASQTIRSRVLDVSWPAGTGVCVVKTVWLAMRFLAALKSMSSCGIRSE